MNIICVILICYNCISCYNIQMTTILVKSFYYSNRLIKAQSFKLICCLQLMWRYWSQNTASSEQKTRSTMSPRNGSVIGSCLKHLSKLVRNNSRNNLQKDLTRKIIIVQQYAYGFRVGENIGHQRHTKIITKRYQLQRVS